MRAAALFFIASWAAGVSGGSKEGSSHGQRRRLDELSDSTIAKLVVPQLGADGGGTDPVRFRRWWWQC